jgi:hypothetical protein
MKTGSIAVAVWGQEWLVLLSQGTQAGGESLPRVLLCLCRSGPDHGQLMALLQHWAIFPLALVDF